MHWISNHDQLVNVLCTDGSVKTFSDSEMLFFYMACVGERTMSQLNGCDGAPESNGFIAGLVERYFDPLYGRKQEVRLNREQVGACNPHWVSRLCPVRSASRDHNP